MSGLKYVWDESKNQANRSKHGLDFQEAVTVFEDVEALMIPDPDHSHEEERFILLGFSTRARLLVVCHCYRQDDQVIRLISARKASHKESVVYHAKGR